MTGNKLMEEIRGDEEGGKGSAEHLSQLGTSPEVPVCPLFFCWLRTLRFTGFNLHR